MNIKVAVRAAIIAAQIRERYPDLAKLKLHPDKMASLTYAALVEGGWVKEWDQDAWIIAGQVSEYLKDLAQTDTDTDTCRDSPLHPGRSLPA